MIQRILLAIAAVLGAVMVSPDLPKAQIYDCGFFNQRPCQRCYFTGDDTVCGDKYCERQLSLIDNRCLINRSGWQTKGLDTSRGLCGGINCWQHDDQVRDQLDMNPGHLNFLYTFEDGASGPSDGRYIYVYRNTDNQLVLRRYDRAHNDRGDACLSDVDYRFPGNNPGNGRPYMHVRHSQLNGGWSNVWCAGELSIKDGRLWRLNNESGHFKPPAACLAYVERTFVGYGYRKHADFASGDFNQVRAQEVCGSAPSTPPGPDDHDEL